MSTEWLAAHLGDDAVRIIEVDEKLDVYESGHVPGAIGFDWERDLRGADRRLIDPAEFARLVGERGIGNDHLVVTYGDLDNWFAAYLYWAFFQYGHRRLRLLDGGRSKWVAEGRPLESEVPSYPPTKFEIEATEGGVRAASDDVERAQRTGGSIVDVRTPDEFEGELATLPGYEHESPGRSGHIPGSRSAPWDRALDDDGTFKPAGELREAFAPTGALEGDGPVVTYCLLGGRSAHSWFVLHELLGIEDAASYEGGWSEWGGRDDLPAETGPPGRAE